MRSGQASGKMSIPNSIRWKGSFSGGKFLRFGKASCVGNSRGARSFKVDAASWAKQRTSRRPSYPPCRPKAIPAEGSPGYPAATPLKRFSSPCKQRSPSMPAPYRADHIGSFLRSPELLEARKSNADEQKLREIEDREILRVLAKQKELGFEIFTDGELRRRNFMSDFMDAVEGFDMGGAVGRMWSGDGAEAARVSGIVTRKLKQTGRLTGRELPFLKQHSPGAIKMTLPSPTQFPAIDR